MHKKIKAFVSLSLILCFVLTSFNIDAVAAFLTFETQFEYEKSDIAWLTDLVVKEDMATIAGLAERTDLIAKPVYPYTETAESFKKDVSYYCSLYTLDVNSSRTALLYFMASLTGQFGIIAGDIADDDIITYLESAGVVIPEDMTEDKMLAARAVYVAMTTGAFASITSGASLDSVLMDLTSAMSGMSEWEIKKWMPDPENGSYEDYLLAASKLTLWTNGYDVDIDTDEETVYRNIAYMALGMTGISSESDLSLEETKSKYTAAMLGVKYGVSVDSDKLDECIKNDTVALYILQLIGKSHSLAMRDGEYTLETAFDTVAANTGVFDIEPGEFYADITDYEVSLKHKRDSIWIYPTAYATNNSSYMVTVTVDGKVIRNNYYNEIAIDSEKEEQTLVIKVVATGTHASSEFTYKLLVKQGKDVAVVPPTGNDPSQNEEQNTFLSSDSFVAKVLESAGMSSYITSILDTSYTPLITLTPIVKNTISFVAPSFNADIFNFDLGILSGINSASDGKYFSVLDEIGGLSDSDISGIGGIDIGSFTSLDGLKDIITF